MTLNRYAKRRDKAEGPIIEALERAGFDVWVLDKPCDIMCRKPTDPPGRFWALEIKTGRKKSGDHINASHKPQREVQELFLSQSMTPVVCTPMEALTAVGVFMGGEP